MPLAVSELAANSTTEGPLFRIMPSFENHRSPAASKTRPHGPSILAKVGLWLELSVTSAKTTVGLPTVPPELGMRALLTTNICAAPLSAKYRFPLLNASPRIPVEPLIWNTAAGTNPVPLTEVNWAAVKTNITFTPGSATYRLPTLSNTPNCGKTKPGTPPEFVIANVGVGESL